MRRQIMWPSAVAFIFLSLVSSKAQEVTSGEAPRYFLDFLPPTPTGFNWDPIRNNDKIATAVSVVSSNTKSINNTASGVNALTSNTTGRDNTATGVSALSSNTAGFNNTASGVNALTSNTAGFNNTASGVNALVGNTTGSNNSATGVSALSGNTTGFNNTAIGNNALTSNTTGHNNSASGLNALTSNTTGYNNTASGLNALTSNTTGYNNTASGISALSKNIRGSANTASGHYALISNGTGGYNTAIGYGADVSVGNLSNATAIGARATVNASNKVRVGDTKVTVIEGAVAFTFTSDKTKKENFKPVDGERALGKIRGLNLTSWNYKGHDPKQLRHYGAMAQDFFAAFGHDDVGTIGTPTTINSGDMDGILMIAAQALEKRTVEQEKEIADLKARLETLERKMGAQVAANAAVGL